MKKNAKDRSMNTKKKKTIENEAFCRWLLPVDVTVNKAMVWVSPSHSHDRLSNVHSVLKCQPVEEEYVI